MPQLMPKPHRRSPVLPPPLVWFIGICLAGITPVSFAQESPDQEPAQETGFSEQQLEFFETKVRPLLVNHCYDCHGPDIDPVEGGLGLTSRQAVLEGGDSGPAIDLENPGESILLSAVQYGDLFQMPPDSRLPDEDIETLRRWIREGAPWPAEDVSDVSREDAFDLEARRDAHWCWQPVQKPVVPPLGENWALDPLDSFILQKLHDHGLSPAPPTDRRTWLRRVTFDLTGIPPTPREIEEFLDDSSGQAFERVVERLLASPRFGERWARHWMDLIRYAETCGHEFDYPIPHAWQYRDYLIRAFNADVPYNDFVVEHIAGDLLEQPRRNPANQINESILGTGFWFLGESTHGPVDVKGDEAGRIDNQIDVMSKSFLGLTVACARCHDHKFDAISTADYYAMSGFLQSSRRQEVMLDPGRKIKTAWQEAQDVAQDASDQIKDELIGHILTMENDEGEFSNHIQAAILFLRDHRQWLTPAEIRLEGESLVEHAQGPGKITRQDIKGWSGGSQLWWTNGKIGDTLEIKFDVPIAGSYEIAADLTKAHDYGIVQILVNDKPVDKPVDLYADHVSRSGEFSLGKFDLASSTNVIKLKISGKNEKAIDGFMAGIDYLILRNPLKNELDMAALSDLDDVAEKFELESGQLRRWVQAIVDPATNNTSHPFRLLRLAAETKLDLDSEEGDDFFHNQLRQLQDMEQSYSRVLHDSDQPDQRISEWATTGPAFQGKQGFGVDASDPDTPFPALAMHSGRSGTRFQGVLRSPTFEINKPRINYLVKARNAKIRVIIDGFRLDQYNPLLFADASIDVDTNGQWRWISQSKDLKNYIGHRAFIEVIDDGDGYIAVADVRFSDEPPPAVAVPFQVAFLPQPEQWRPARLQEDSDALTLLSRSMAKNLDRIMRIGFGYGEYINFLYKHRLIPGLDLESVDRIVSESQAKFNRINEQVPAPVPAIGMTDGSPENEYIFIRGNHKNLGDLAPRAPLEALNSAQNWSFDPEASGRTELARHIVSLDNPLTRRVVVNRIWHHLTGRGLVASVDNFGVLGSQPSHPELLDYLATEFSDGGWSVKSLIRRIVLSQSYRMGNQASTTATESDPDNILLHSARIRRLQGEAIRDSMLAVSGELDDRMYGAPVPVHLTPFMQGRGRPGKSGPVDGDRRRSIYIEVRRNFLAPMMLAFDTPIPFNTIGRRNQSNVPAQALILMNDPFVIEQSAKWATRLIETEPDPRQRIQLMYAEALGRLPVAEEIDHALEFLATQSSLLTDEEDESTEEDAWIDLCHVMFNLKEFIYVR